MSGTAVVKNVVTRAVLSGSQMFTQIADFVGIFASSYEQLRLELECCKTFLLPCCHTKWGGSPPSGKACF